jgi:nucleoside 2-deoxyribosyltransferase
VYVYAIMPVGADREGYALKRDILRRIADEHGYTVHFPLEANEREGDFDLLTALREIDSASFVLADLSMERPSCYYELGLAQAQHKRTFLIARDGTPLHQAYGREQARFYEDRDYAEVVNDVMSQATSPIRPS